MAMMSNLQTGSKSTDHSRGPSGQAFTASNCSGIKACFPYISSGDCVCCSCWSAADCTWIIDTGASDHMCHNENLFIQTQILPKAHHVTLPNGHVVNVHKVGSVRIHPDIILHNVLYIPQFKYNLLLIGKLCKQPFSYAIFTNSKCYFQGPSMKRPLELGDIHSGLYLLQHFPASQAQTQYESSTSDAKKCHRVHAQSNKACNLADFSYTNKCTPSTSQLLNIHKSVDTSLFSSFVHETLCSSVRNNENGHIWHQRLGHLPLYKLKQFSFFPDNSIDTISSCDEARQHRLPFPLSQTQSSHLFYLIHVDVWGPYHTATHGGYHYFLTIVEDFSRATWTHLLKTKSNAFPLLQTFTEMISTQFNTKIKIFRTDNALELGSSREATAFFQSKGILHQTSVRDTPQQNGVVERKHRHLLETARALFIRSKLPIIFWGDCILTATYLINRFPMKILHNKSPFEILFGHSPSYSHLRSFGCYVMHPLLDRVVINFNQELHLVFF